MSAAAAVATSSNAPALATIAAAVRGGIEDAEKAHAKAAREAARKAIKLVCDRKKRYAGRAPMDIVVNENGWVTAKLEATDKDIFRLIYAHKVRRTGKWYIKIV